MLRCGVVGVGVMGINHARILSHLDGCELVGVADKDENRVKEVSELYNTSGFTDYHNLFLEGLDAVSICTPTHLHHKVTSDFLDEAVHCLVEKPISSTIHEAESMIQKAYEKGVKLMVGHIERFNPAVLKLKEILDQGILGQLLMLSIRRVGPYVPRVMDVGIIVDLATHDIDVSRYLLDSEPLNVDARYGRIRHLKEDYASISLDFGDIFVNIETNWFTPHKLRKLVATGTEGIAYLDYIEQDITIHNAEWEIKPKIIHEEPLKIELSHFIECIEKDEVPLVSGEEGLKNLRIALECIKKNDSPNYNYQTNHIDIQRNEGKLTLRQVKHTQSVNTPNE